LVERVERLVSSPRFVERLVSFPSELLWLLSRLERLVSSPELLRPPRLDRLVSSPELLLVPPRFVDRLVSFPLDRSFDLPPLRLDRCDRWPDLFSGERLPRMASCTRPDMPSSAPPSRQSSDMAASASLDLDGGASRSWSLAFLRLGPLRPLRAWNAEGDLEEEARLLRLLRAVPSPLELRAVLSPRLSSFFLDRGVRLDGPRAELRADCGLAGV